MTAALLPRAGSSAGREPTPRGIKWMAGGLLVLQFIWILAVPPFRGSDEFDHVYKAAAVARGDWLPEPSSATRGTGAWVEVPADLVAAARPQCESLEYTDNDDCVGTKSGDHVRIASGAGRYHPLFYALVGVPALPFTGTSALYVMRAATALLCWLLFCCALVAVNGWRRGSWTTTGIAVASTPVLVYSSAVVAPNGVELMAALAFWCAGIGVTHGPAESAFKKQLLIAALSASILVTTRSLGPLWLLLITMTLVLVAPSPRRVARDLLRSAQFLIVCLVVGAVSLMSVAYILAMGSLDVSEPLTKPYSVGHRIQIVSQDVILWILQSIAAFPLRDEPAHPVVYACYVIIFVALTVVTLRLARGRTRAAFLVCIVVGSLVPFIIAVSTFNDHPRVWQGRYGMPYSLGIPILAGYAIDLHRRRVPDLMRSLGLILFAIAHALSPAYVTHNLLSHPASRASHWAEPPVAVVAATAAIGAALLWLGATSTASSGARSSLMSDARERPD